MFRLAADPNRWTSVTPPALHIADDANARGRQDRARLFGVEVEDRHNGAFRRQPPRNGGADAPRGDNRALAP